MTLPFLTCCVLLVAATAASSQTPVDLRSDQVLLPFGLVSGNLNAYGTEFLGIPYAAKPERFEPPRPWTAKFANGTLEAKKYTFQCPQQAIAIPGAAMPPPLPASEDCLHLNVYIPHRTAEEPGLLPVMAWIHGGSLTTGTAMDEQYNASRLAAEQRVVVVAMNYRLNILGFQPVALEDGSIVANNGFKDQQEALRWIQSHIEAFGGNASHVTIFGESAGGQSVAVQMVSPLSAKLFHAAISESGDVTNMRDLSEALNATSAVAANLSCRDLNCLKTINATKLVDTFLALYPTLSSAAVVDGELLPASPVEMAQRGSSHKLPLILGTNAQEASLFISSSALTEDQVQCSVEKSVGAVKARAIFDLYPTTPGADNRDVFVTIVTDLMFACGKTKLAAAQAAAGSPTWVYEFVRHPKCAIVPDPGAGHAFEMPYVFDIVAEITARVNKRQNTSCIVAPDDLELARTVSSLWGSFARNGKAVGAWPRFESPKQEVAKLDVGTTVEAIDTESGYRRRQCQELEQAGLAFSDGSAITRALKQCTPELIFV